MIWHYPWYGVVVDDDEEVVDFPAAFRAPFLVRSGDIVPAQVLPALYLCRLCLIWATILSDGFTGTSGERITAASSRAAKNLSSCRTPLNALLRLGRGGLLWAE